MRARERPPVFNASRSYGRTYYTYDSASPRAQIVLDTRGGDFRMDIELDTQHRPPSHARVRQMATLIMRESGSHETLGKRWMQPFIQRHPSIATLVGKPQETVRIHEATEENVRGWFERLAKFKSRYNIQDENIWNFDEHGMGLGVCSDQYVIGKAKDEMTKKRRKNTKISVSQDRKWVSIIECISAAGSSIEPVIIFKGKSIQLDWMPKPIPMFKYTSTENAWTNNDVGVWWLNEVFIPQTRLRGSAYRLLICDNHESHISTQFELDCKRQRIVLLTLPPHTSDVLQPLDLRMFSPLKTKYRDKLYGLQQMSDTATTKKKEFLNLYREARQETMNKRNIHACWKKAGIVPWDVESVVASDEVIKRDKTPPLHDNDNIPSPVITPKGPRDLENALFKITNDPTLDTPTKNTRLIRLCQKTTKPLTTLSVNNATKELELQSKQYEIDQMNEKKPKRKINPKKGRHLVDHSDATAAVENFENENAPPPKRAQTRREKMKA